MKKTYILLLTLLFVGTSIHTITPAPNYDAPLVMHCILEPEQ